MEAVEPMMTTVPPAGSSGIAGWTVNRTPLAFTLKVFSNCSSVIAPSGAWAPMPALATTASRRPWRAMTSWYIVSMSASLVTSATMPEQFGPTVATASSSGFCCSSVMTTRAPWSTNSWAIPRPTPDAPPVTTATLPSNRRLIVFSFE